MPQAIIVTIDSDLQEIIPSFLENRKKDLSKIEEYLQTSNWSHIESIAHKLAGNAGSYGFDELGHIGASLEQACQSNHVEAIRDYCQQYQHYMDHLEVKFE